MKLIRESTGQILLIIIFAVLSSTIGSADNLKGFKKAEEQSILIGRFDRSKIIDYEKYHRMKADISVIFPRRFELGPYGSSKTIHIKTRDNGFFALVLESGLYFLQIEREDRSKYRFSRFLVPQGEVLNIGTYNMKATDYKMGAGGNNMYYYQMFQNQDAEAMQEPVAWFKETFPDIYQAYENKISNYLDKQEEGK